MTTKATYPASKVHVFTSKYERSHGRSPRGRGSWVFFMGGELFWAKHSQTYGAAKREAQAEAGRRGLTFCEVAP